MQHNTIKSKNKINLAYFYTFKIHGNVIWYEIIKISKFKTYQGKSQYIIYVFGVLFDQFLVCCKIYVTNPCFLCQISIFEYDIYKLF